MSLFFNHLFNKGFWKRAKSYKEFTRGARIKTAILTWIGSTVTILTFGYISFAGDIFYALKSQIKHVGSKKS